MAEFSTLLAAALANEPDIVLPVEPYDATSFNGSQKPVSQDAVRDKIEALLIEAGDPATWSQSKRMYFASDYGTNSAALLACMAACNVDRGTMIVDRQYSLSSAALTPSNGVTIKGTGVYDGSAGTHGSLITRTGSVGAVVDIRGNSVTVENIKLVSTGHCIELGYPPGGNNAIGTTLRSLILVPGQGGPEGGYWCIRPHVLWDYDHEGGSETDTFAFNSIFDSINCQGYNDGTVNGIMAHNHSWTRNMEAHSGVYVCWNAPSGCQLAGLDGSRNESCTYAHVMGWSRDVSLGYGNILATSITWRHLYAESCYLAYDVRGSNFLIEDCYSHLSPPNNPPATGGVDPIAEAIHSARFAGSSSGTVINSTFNGSCIDSNACLLADDVNITWINSGASNGYAGDHPTRASHWSPVNPAMVQGCTFIGSCSNVTHRQVSGSNVTLRGINSLNTLKTKVSSKNLFIPDVAVSDGAASVTYTFPYISDASKAGHQALTETTNGGAGVKATGTITLTNGAIDITAADPGTSWNFPSPFTLKVSIVDGPADVSFDWITRGAARITVTVPITATPASATITHISNLIDSLDEFDAAVDSGGGGAGVAQANVEVAMTGGTKLSPGEWTYRTGRWLRDGLYLHTEETTTLTTENRVTLAFYDHTPYAGPYRNVAFARLTGELRWRVLIGNLNSNADIVDDGQASTSGYGGWFPPDVQVNTSVLDQRETDTDYHVFCNPRWGASGGARVAAADISTSAFTARFTGPSGSASTIDFLVVRD